MNRPNTNPGIDLNPIPSSVPLPTIGFIKKLTQKITTILLGRDITTYPQVLGQTSETGASDASYTSFTNPYWRINYERRSIAMDLRDMDYNSSIVSTALDVISDCATGFESPDVDAFLWQFDQNVPGAEKILQEMKIRCDLGHECWRIVRGFVRDGEEFREVVADESYTIRRFKFLPNYQVTPALDPFGNKTSGWEQRLDGANFGRPILFAEWQVCPFIYGARRGYYGTGLMMPARRDWKRLTKMEDGMALARMIRAYDRLIHYVPVKESMDERAQKDAVKNYYQNILRRRGVDQDNNLFWRENPLQVESDFFLPDDGTGRGKVEILESKNNQLMNIDDVLYHQALLLCRLKVPAKYLQLVRKSAALIDANLSAEDIQFARTLRQVQAVLRQGLLRLAHYALAFQGYDADAVGVGIVLPKISTEDQLRDAKIQFTASQAALTFSQVLPHGLPPDLVASKYMSLDPDDKKILSEWIAAGDETHAALHKQMGIIIPDSKIPGAPGAQNFKPFAKASTMAGDDGGDEDDSDSGSDATQSQVTFDQVAQSLTNLQMLAQAEMERRGTRFKVGRTERLDNTRRILQEVFDNSDVGSTL